MAIRKNMTRTGFQVVLIYQPTSFSAFSAALSRFLNEVQNIVIIVCLSLTILLVSFFELCCVWYTQVFAILLVILFATFFLLFVAILVLLSNLFVKKYSPLILILGSPVTRTAFCVLTLIHLFALAKVVILSYVVTVKAVILVCIIGGQFLYWLTSPFS